jgi:hypothetical protein
MHPCKNLLHLYICFLFCYNCLNICFLYPIPHVSNVALDRSSVFVKIRRKAGGLCMIFLINSESGKNNTGTYVGLNEKLYMLFPLSRNLRNFID